MTPERMSWDEDEGLYQPKIHSKHIRALHQISRELGEPMTVMVDRALPEFVARQEGMRQRRDGVTNLVAESVGAMRA